MAVGLELGVVTEPPGPSIKFCKAGCSKNNFFSTARTEHVKTRREGKRVGRCRCVKREGETNWKIPHVQYFIVLARSSTRAAA